MKYRKKPVVIDAVGATALLFNAANQWNKLPTWIVKAYDLGNILFLNDSIKIETLEGTMTASRGDYVIHGIKGEIYPCKPDIFEATYEVAEDHE